MKAKNVFIVPMYGQENIQTARPVSYMVVFESGREHPIPERPGYEGEAIPTLQLGGTFPFAAYAVGFANWLKNGGA